MQDPLETAELLAFARTVEAQSLSRAAAELGLPRATVSRRLARMEQRLGVRLIRRTTRRLVLTDAGAALYRRARAILEAVSEAERSVEVHDQRVRGRLRVSVPPSLPESFGELVCDFLVRYPDVRMELRADSRHVDLVQEGYDLALRAGTVSDEGLVCRVLQREALAAYAAPGYLRKHGTPRTARDLLRHACLCGFTRGETAQTHWPLRKGGQARVDAVYASNDLHAILAACRRGLGIALIPTLFAADLVGHGTLVPVLQRVVGTETQLTLVYPERELVAPAVRAFLDAVTEWVARELTPERCRGGA